MSRYWNKNNIHYIFYHYGQYWFQTLVSWVHSLFSRYPCALTNGRSMAWTLADINGFQKADKGHITQMDIESLTTAIMSLSGSRASAMLWRHHQLHQVIDFLRVRNRLRGRSVIKSRRTKFRSTENRNFLFRCQNSFLAPRPMPRPMPRPRPMLISKTCCSETKQRLFQLFGRNLWRVGLQNKIDIMVS